MAGGTVAELARACAPALQKLTYKPKNFRDLALFVNLGRADEAATAVGNHNLTILRYSTFSCIAELPIQAVMRSLRFFENEALNYAPVLRLLGFRSDELQRLYCAVVFSQSLLLL
jgi:type III restriction enzyme